MKTTKVKMSMAEMMATKMSNEGEDMDEADRVVDGFEDC